MCTLGNLKKTSNTEPGSKTTKIIRGVISTMARHIFFIIRMYVDLLIDLVYSFFWEGTRKAIPDLEKRHSILMESAVSLAAKIRNKELKSEELVNACIERIQSVNPVVNAVTDERFEEARKEAKEIDKMIADGLSDEEFAKKPFLGVPFTSKESHGVKGMLYTLGIKARAHVRAHEHAECVRRLAAAGAVPVAVTNVPEVNKWAESRNMVFGQTNNPYHTGRTTGGSSGGEAALAACMASPISLCSDVGGSTRMPAFYCGLFGLVPTAGHTSLKGSALRTGEEDSMASIGFLSRHCSDLGPLTKIIVDNAEDIDFDRVVDLKDIKYFYVETAQDLRVSPICPELRKAMNKVITKLSEEAPSSDSAPKRYYHTGFNYMFTLWRYWMTREAEVFARMLTNNTGEANAFVELAKKLVGMGDYTLAAILKLFDDQVLPKVNAEWAERLTTELKDDLLSTLGSEGVLLFPSAPSPAPYHHSMYLRPFNFGYWAIFNVLRCPAIQVPLGLSSEGLPLGIQVVAAPKNEALCLAVAEHLSKAFGGFVPPCRVLD